MFRFSTKNPSASIKIEPAALGTFFLTPAHLLVLSILLTGTAQAGSWQVEYYQEVSLTNVTQPSNPNPPTTYTALPSGGRTTLINFSTGQFAYSDAKQVTRAVSCVEHMRLRWNPSDASDLPPQYIIMRDALYYGGSNSVAYLSPAQKQAAFDGLTIRFECDKAPSITYREVSPAPNNYSVSKIVDYVNPAFVYLVDNPDRQSIVSLPSVTASIYMKNNNPTLGQIGQGFTCYHDVSTCTFIWLMRKGPGDPYVSFKFLPAGAKEFRNEVEVRIAIFNSGTNLVNRDELGQVLTKFRPILLQANGAEADGEFVTGPDPDPGLSNNGYYLGKYKVSDKRSNITLKLPIPGSSSSPAALAPVDTTTAVNQMWDDQNNWKTGAAGDQPLSQFVTFDTPFPLTFRPKFANALPNIHITGHTMNFKVIKATIWEWDQVANTTVRRTYTTKYYEANALSNPPVIYKPDLSELASFDQPQSQDVGTAQDPGQYKTNCTIPFNPEKLIESITVGAEDDSVWRVDQ